jgi:disulfide bond formation protein DsbB
MFVLIEIFKVKNPVKNFILKYRFKLISVVSCASVIGSILLSVYFKLAPCELCWYQRLFLFTIPIISIISLWKKDQIAHLYVFVLSTIGAGFALYHSLIQLSVFKADSVFCNPGAVVDCALPAFTYFGFVTVPVISFATFTLLMILSYAYTRE